MDIAKIGTQILLAKLGGGGSSDAISGALSSLLGGGDNKGGFDLGSLISKMQGDGGSLASLAASFLGDGDNDNMSGNDVTSLLGNDKIADFASKLGIDTETAASGLSDALPSMIDKASSGGELLEAFGGLSGLLNKAKSFL